MGGFALHVGGAPKANSGPFCTQGSNTRPLSPPHARLRLVPVRVNLQIAAGWSGSGAWKPLYSCWSKEPASRALPVPTPGQIRRTVAACHSQQDFGQPPRLHMRPSSGGIVAAMADQPMHPQSRDTPAIAASNPGLECLYRSHLAWLKRALRYRLGGGAIEIDDVIQDTYIRVARYTDADTHHRPKALLLRIALNLARDQFRQKARMPANDVDRTDDISVEGDQEYLLALKQTILSLPPDLRSVFLLSRYTAMTNAQIAKHLGVSVKTVEYRMRKALLHCSEQLER